MLVYPELRGRLRIQDQPQLCSKLDYATLSKTLYFKKLIKSSIKILKFRVTKLFVLLNCDLIKSQIRFKKHKGAVSHNRNCISD